MTKIRIIMQTLGMKSMKFLTTTAIGNAARGNWNALIIADPERMALVPPFIHFDEKPKKKIPITKYPRKFSIPRDV